MLLKVIIDFLLGILNLIIGLFPTIRFPETDELNFSVISDLIGYFDTVISFKLILACFASIFIVDNFGFFTRILKFILNKFGLS